MEIEVTPPGKSTKRLALLSGGEKSLNIDRFLRLVRRYSDRAQFIVVTHQKRTRDAADTL